QAARSSACCRPTTRPAISPKSCNASRQIADRTGQPAGGQVASRDVGDRDNPHRHDAPSAMTVAATGAPALPAASRCPYPVIGVVAVLVGAFISTLNVRITTTGLADIRGALGLGFDEGSWVSTIFFAAQMVVTPAAAWMSTVLSTRRVLLWTGATFAVASLLPPFLHDYDTLIALQFI